MVMGELNWNNLLTIIRGRMDGVGADKYRSSKMKDCRETPFNSSKAMEIVEMLLKKEKICWCCSLASQEWGSALVVEGSGSINESRSGT